jgi:hypothetical protein
VRIGSWMRGQGSGAQGLESILITGWMLLSLEP